MESGTRMTYRVLGFCFRVQSSEYNPLHLHERINNFINDVKELLVIIFFILLIIDISDLFFMLSIFIIHFVMVNVELQQIYKTEKRVRDKIFIVRLMT